MEPITDEVHDRVFHLFRLRLPWLLLGLAGGTAVTFMVSGFEKILAHNLSLAFFLPAVVYLSDAAGTQTEALYIRALSRGRIHFLRNLLKEVAIGLLLGLTLGSLLGLIAWLWLANLKISLVVGLSMTINLTFAPALAILTSQILYKEHTDPALGAGPVSTIIQDGFSLAVYFATAGLILGTF